MNFNSFLFIFVFFPLSLCGYFGFNYYKKYKLADIFLIIMSCLFFAYTSIFSFIAVAISIIVNYSFIILIRKYKNKKIILFLSILVNVCSLLYLKYLNFFIESVNALFNSDISIVNIVIPLGISYFTFQQIAYLVDNYKGEVPEYSFCEYCLFITFYPKVLAGPILLHGDIMPQFKDKSRKKINYDNISKGIYAISLGMAKKVLLAEKFGNAVNVYYDNLTQMNTATAILAVLGFTFQIYFDFSGYCDIATGICCMFNIELPKNFDSPYKSYSINEFWDRWHISLTRFFTKYIYIPLGGNRKGKVRTYVNIFVVFLISGLWHGAAWTYIIWGIAHGIMHIIDRAFKRYIDSWNNVFKWMITFVSVNIAWIFFRAPGFNEIKSVVYSLLALKFDDMPNVFIEVFQTKEISIIMEILNIGSDYRRLFIGIIILIYYIFAFVVILNFKNVNEQIKEFSPTIDKSILAGILLAISILYSNLLINHLLCRCVHSCFSLQ